MLTLNLIGFFVILGVLLFYNLSAFYWLVVYSTILSVFYYTSYISGFFAVCSGVSFLIIFTLLALKPIRRKVITSNFLEFFKKKLPKISKTESQAIEAGDVWWEGDVFSANINWSRIENNKLTELTKDEQDYLNNQTEKLCSLIQDWEIVNKDKDLSKEAWDYLKQHQFFAINIPKEYGGLGFSATAQSSIITKIATKSISAAVSVMVPNALGPAELLVHYGTDKQKQQYLPKLANCKDIPCFALTSLHAGSDAGGMSDYGVICKQKLNDQEVLGIKLNFNKRYITLAPVATVMGLAFKLFDPDKLYSDKEDLGISLCLIPTNYPGIDIGRRHYPMLSPFQNGPIIGKDVFIPMDFIIGGENYIGKGWYMLMECLSSGRGISLPALSTATTQLSTFSSFAYSSLRKQFKIPIAKLEGIQEHLARISGLNFIANAMRVVTASAIDKGLKPAVVSGIAKYHMTEFARAAINSAMDIHGGKGVMNGPQNYLSSQYIASPIAITVEGANILTRNLIIFGQGAFRAHPYILQELEALQDSDTQAGLIKFDTVLFKHIKFVCSTIIRLKVYNFQRIYRPLINKQNWLRAYQKDLTRMSCSLAFVTDMALLFIGGKLKTKERISARLGDVVSNIYMSMTVINYYNYLKNSLEASNLSNHDKKMSMRLLDAHVKWSLEYLLYSANIALGNVIRNFPVKSIAMLLKVITMPWGQSHKYPKDSLEQELCLGCELPNEYFKKITELCYKNGPGLGDLSKAYQLQYTNRELLAKIENLAKDKKILYTNNIGEVAEDAYGKNLLTESEYNSLIDLADIFDTVISVDAFNNLNNTVSNTSNSFTTLNQEVESD